MLDYAIQIRMLPDKNKNYMALTGNYSVAGFELTLRRKVMIVSLILLISLILSLIISLIVELPSIYADDQLDCCEYVDIHKFGL